MIQLEIRLSGHPRIAKEMTAYLPGKYAKHIRDKRETAYRNLLQHHLSNVETTSSHSRITTEARENVSTSLETTQPNAIQTFETNGTVTT